MLFKMYQVTFAALSILLIPLVGYVLTRWFSKKTPIFQTNTSPARKNLQDDGKISWDEQSESYLTKHYPNWKQLQHTIMVPDIVQRGNPLTYPEPNEKAESKVFELLKKFGNDHENQQPMFVVHNRSFSELIHYWENGIKKTEWIQGDHDFVIIHREHGLIFLEVKGRQKMKEVFKKGEEQVEKAKKSVESYLRKRFGKSKEINKAFYKFPGFVVMPNCPRPGQSQHENGIFKEDCENVNSFQKWWKKSIVQPQKKHKFSKELFEKLVIKFVPFTCSAPPLNLQIDNTHKEILILTPNQLKSWYKSCPEQWISGPAGSGKTVLLIEKVKQIASDIIEGVEHTQERILVLCCSLPLTVHLENEFSDWFNRTFPSMSSTCPVHVKTYKSFIDEIEGNSDRVMPGQKDLFAKRRKNVEDSVRPPPKEHTYEHIFVDEGQDMVGDRWPEFLKTLHRQSSDSRRYHFWIMYDSNQHLQRTMRSPSFLNKITRNTSQLTEVLRNTKNIFVLSNKYYKGISDGKITLGHDLLGLEVKYDIWTKNNMCELVANHVKELKESKVIDKDIAVLVRNIRSRDYLIKVLKNKYEITCVTVENRLRNKDADAIAIDTIKAFKGLESKVVVLCDPPCELKNDPADRTREFLYTAVSRCFCYLIILSTYNGCERIKTARLHVESMENREQSEYFASSEDND